VKPVALPPGRARLSTKPAPTGSATNSGVRDEMGIIAQKLTEQGIEAPRGGAWSQMTVLRVMARLGLATAR